jgi:hypothetical protein
MMIKKKKLILIEKLDKKFKTMTQTIRIPEIPTTQINVPFGKFDIVPAKQLVFQIAANQWIVSAPLDFPATLICLKIFSSITIRSSSTITVPAGCHITLK